MAPSHATQPSGNPLQHRVSPPRRVELIAPGHHCTEPAHSSAHSAQCTRVHTARRTVMQSEHRGTRAIAVSRGPVGLRRPSHGPHGHVAMHGSRPPLTSGTAAGHGGLASAEQGSPGWDPRQERLLCWPGRRGRDSERPQRCALFTAPLSRPTRRLVAPPPPPPPPLGRRTSAEPEHSNISYDIYNSLKAAGIVNLARLRPPPAAPRGRGTVEPRAAHHRLSDASAASASTASAASAAASRSSRYPGALPSLMQKSR